MNASNSNTNSSMNALGFGRTTKTAKFGRFYVGHKAQSNVLFYSLLKIYVI